MAETSITMTKRPMQTKEAQNRPPGDWDSQQGPNKVNKTGSIDISQNVPPIEL
jgi:hypothetical protein